MDDITIRRCDLDETPPPMDAALAYWRDLTGERLAPSWREFDLAKLPPRLLPSTVVYDVIDDGREFRIRYYGSGMTRVHGVDLTGRSPLDFPWRPLGEFLHREMQNVLENRQPEHLTYIYTKPDRPAELQNVLRLPLSDDGQRVSHIVSLIAFTMGIEASQEFFESRANP